jgi:hypothetical protein
MTDKIVEKVLDKVANKEDYLDWKTAVKDKNRYGHPEYDWDWLIEDAVRIAVAETRKETVETGKEIVEKDLILLEAFCNSVLCHSCWRKFLVIENRPNLAKRFVKWFNGEYSNNSQAIKQLIKRIEKDKVGLSKKGEVD